MAQYIIDYYLDNLDNNIVTPIQTSSLIPKIHNTRRNGISLEPKISKCYNDVFRSKHSSLYSNLYELDEDITNELPGLEESVEVNEVNDIKDIPKINNINTKYTTMYKIHNTETNEKTDSNSKNKTSLKKRLTNYLHKKN